MNSQEIVSRRMHNQRLRGTRFKTPKQGLSWLGAIQAQEYPYAKWSIGQRADALDDDDIERAFSAGQIIRTHVLRPTWHFVGPADIRWMLSLTTPRVHVQNTHPYTRNELDPKTLARSDNVIARTLADGEHLTRKEIADALDRARLPAKGQRLVYMLMHAELEAIICSGGRRGKQHTYALLDKRVRAAKPLQRDKALEELARRYFTARGPATVKDFSWWSSLTVADCRAGVEMLGSKLVSTRTDDRTYWYAPSKAPQPSSRKIADLLQVYDEYVMSYSESRDAIRVQPTTETRTVFGTHAVMFDGRLIGHWRRATDKESVVIQAGFYGSPSRAQKSAVEEAVGRFGRFLGLPATLYLM